MRKIEQPREPRFYPNETILSARKAEQAMEEKEKNVYTEERELLHKQLQLLAERSKNVNLCPDELATLSNQMVSIYSVLKL